MSNGYQIGRRVRYFAVECSACGAHGAAELWNDEILEPCPKCGGKLAEKHRDRVGYQVTAVSFDGGTLTLAPEKGESDANQ